MKFGSTCLFVEDVPAVMDFYKRAFGFERTFYDDDYEFGDMNAGGASLSFGSYKCGERMMPGGFRPPTNRRTEGVEIAFFVDDVQAAFARACDAGAEVVAQPKQMPWGQTVAYVRSMEGTLIGLCTPPDK